MRTLITAALAAALLLPTAGYAQKLVRQESIRALPDPVLLDTSGMFLQRYAKVGDDLFIAGQPTERALREMKAQGITTVVNLRMPAEMARVGYDEKKLVEELGMKYVHIPMRGGEGEFAYSPQTLSKFADVMQSADGKVLLHCTIAWRASHIWAAYLIQRGVPELKALDHARAINLMDDHRMDESGRQPVEMFLGRKLDGIRRP
ncbi:MAG TPA: sulfur transferase domain-containing protein [Gemmatimonadaceae bacterium]|nr:sulfur transferase domain-containing protein [Gemmatimonadaceae bacterium]